MTRRTKALGLVFSIAACSDSPTSIVVEVTYDEALRLDQLDVTADGIRTSVGTVSEVTLLLPDSVAGRPLPIAVDGMRAATRFAYGETTVTPRAGEEVRTALALVPLTGLVDEGPHAWDSSQAPLALGAWQDRLCFLTVVSGAFTSEASNVTLSVPDRAWTFGAPSASTVSAQAHCIRWAAESGITLSAEFQWAQGQPPVDMGSATNRICMLTRVAGFYAGGGEIAAALVEAGRWKLRGQSARVGVTASARCLSWPENLNITYSDEVHWAQGLPTRILGAAPDRVCMLTMFTGMFTGVSERVSVVRGGSDWVLDGSSATAGVATYARCMSWVN